MGLGKLFTRGPAVEPEQLRAITEFAIIDGVAVDGTGASGSRYQGGMQIPGAWRCALLISDLIGLVPWYAYRERGGLPVERLNPTPLILQKPNPQETGMSTRSSWALDLVWHGNAVGIIAARNRDGWPTAAIPVPASMVGVRRVLPGGMASVFPIGAIEYNVAGLKFGEHEVMHVKGPCQPGDVRGMGVIEAHFDTMTLARELARQARSVSQHGVPTGKLKVSNPDATKADLLEAKAGWMTAQRDRTVAVLNATTEFEPLAWNPEQLQLVEARKFSLHELALIFGLPLSLLGVESSNRTYRNDETESINILKWGMSGHIARFEQTYTELLPSGTWAKANLKAMLRADTLTRYQAHQVALGSGFMTMDEVREEEDRAPLPEPSARPAPPVPTTDTEEETDDVQ